MLFQIFIRGVSQLNRFILLLGMGGDTQISKLWSQLLDASEIDLSEFFFQIVGLYQRVSCLALGILFFLLIKFFSLHFGIVFSPNF